MASAFSPGDRYIVAIDIVGYSERTPADQIALINHLNQNVSEVVSALHVKPLYLPTGDGMFVAFSSNDHVKALMFATQISRKCRGASGTRLKMAIWYGTIVPINDINGKDNVAGAGINLAARLESCCSAEHILVDARLHDGIDSFLVDPTSIGLDASSQFHGPHTFRVKHGELLHAYNYFGADFGNAAAPEKNVVLDLSHFRSLRERLTDWDIRPSKLLEQSWVRDKYDQAGLVVVGSTVIDTPLNGFQGVPPEKVMVRMERSIESSMPPPVLSRRSSTPPPEVNRAKVHLIQAAPPIGDKGNTLSVTLAISDYAMSLAIKGHENEIIEDLRKEHKTPDEFPGRLNAAIVVVTADSKLILVKRRKDVDYYEGLWHVVGETMDATKDQDHHRGMRPERTVMRGLMEPDELNLRGLSAADVDIKFLALATVTRYLVRDFIVLVRLKRMGAEEVRAHYAGGEHQGIRFIPYTIDDCLKILRDENEQRASTDDYVCDEGLACVLLALFAEFGPLAVLNKVGNT